MWKKFNIEQDTIREEGMEISCLKVQGYLDSSTFHLLQERLESLVSMGNCRCVLDFEQLDYVSSAGLGVLMQMLGQVREKGGDLIVVGMSDKIKRVFDLLGFSRIMKSFSDIAEATDEFRRQLDRASSETGDDSQKGSEPY